MTFNAIDTVLYTLAFFVPGFIMNSVFSRFCSEDRPATQLLLLRFLTFSAFNYGLWFWLVYLIIESDFFVFRPALTAFAWVIMIFISPFFLGACLGIAEQRQLGYEFFRKRGIQISPMHNHTALEEVVEQFTTVPYVLVTLSDGREIRGILGENSRLTTQSKGGDLYLDKVVKVNPAAPNEPWVEVENNAGIWIKGSEIKIIEFWG